MSFRVYICIMIQVIVAIVLFFFLPITHGATTPIVTTSKGPVIGSTLSSQSGKAYSQFLGLRYADPPIGKLRFSRTTEFSGPAWTDPKDATKSGPDCLQVDVPDSEVTGQEDCLTLNVYKPSQCSKETPCPVIVWIHPGQFYRSGSSPEEYGPQLWMDFDVILVSINYRLGVLGFLSLDTEEAAGNAGLWDQQLALKWVKKEIKSFGGNPESVTLLGSDSGATSALLHLLSPANKGQGLFHKVIAQSGPCLQDTWLNMNQSRRNFGLALAKLMDCSLEGGDKKILSCLRVKPARELAGAIRAFKASGSHMLPNPFVPATDGSHSKTPFLTKSPEDLMSNPVMNLVPVLIGTNSEDGMQLMSEFLQHPSTFENFTESLPLLALQKYNKDVTDDDLELLQIVKRSYITEGPSNHRYRMREGIRLFSDLRFHSSTGKAVKQLVSNNVTVYQYVYKYSGSHSFGDFLAYGDWKVKFKLLLHSFGIGFNMRTGYGTSHGDELLSMFKLGKLPDPMSKGPLSERDKLTSRRVLKSWVNFATHGDPSIHDDIDSFNWLPSTAPDYQFNTIKSEFAMTKDEHFWKMVNFFEKVFQARQNGLPHNRNSETRKKKRSGLPKSQKSKSEL